MSFFRRCLAVVIGAVVGVLVPAVAWAASNETALEVARRRPRLGGAGLFAGLCCLVVVAIVVLGLLMLMRGRRGRR